MKSALPPTAVLLSPVVLSRSALSTKAVLSLPLVRFRLSTSEFVPPALFLRGSLLVGFVPCPQLGPTRRIRTRPVIPTARLHDNFINNLLAG